MIFFFLSVVYVLFFLFLFFFFFFFSSRRRHTRFDCDWSSDVCSSDLVSFGHHDLGPEDEERIAHRLFAAIGTVVRGMVRSEERRVGKECRSRWSPYH